MNRYSKKALFIIGTVMSLAMFPMTAKAADYTVAQNDSLYKVSKLFDTSVKKIKTDNDLTSNVIQKGDKLTVNAKVYKVKEGDTLSSIAKKYGISLADLRKANNKWNDQLKPGKKLILPGVKNTNSKKAVIKYTNEEFDLLARLITAEATGQPYNAMVGIGGVVVNRVQSKEWPNSIDKVINHVAGEYYQFTPVKNGYINKPASDIAKKAAKAALTGSDPSKGAMFYFDDSATNAWLWSKPQTAYIGNMVFVK